MNSKEILSKKKEILNYLSKRQVRNAIKSLNNLAINSQDWSIMESLTELETNYKFMLHYLFEDTEDGEREKVYNNLIRSLYETTDDLSDDLLKNESSNIYYDRLRINDISNTLLIKDIHLQLKNISTNLSLIDLLEDGDHKTNKKKDLLVKRERIASEMFNAFFISPRTNEETLIDFKSFIDSMDIEVREKCLFISAINLNLLHRFDSKKVQFLMHASNSDDIQVKVRAIVGLIIILQMYSVRWKYYPELQHQLETFSENENFRKIVLKIIIQLIRSRETEKISKKITEEILPEMMRFNNLAGKKLNIEEILSDADLSAKNPEWKKELEQSGLVDKLQEYSNLQMEGADVFHSTFSSLKSFSFFSELGNWFMPFDTNYSEISSMFTHSSNNELLRAAIVKSNQMCNSDKYSFCLSLLQIPSSQRDRMLTQMGAESEDIKQMQSASLELNTKKQEELVSNQYIQDLYRFFKLNPHRGNFYDIFELKLNFYDKKSIAQFISDTYSIKEIAHYCFEKNYFSEALQAFSLLVKLGQDSGDVWQKIGYCHQMLSSYTEALEAYLQADLIIPNNSWTLRRIAHIYRTQKKYEEAIEYYKKASSLIPNNMALELNIGHCYLEMKDYEKALNCYFKVQLSDTKESSKALRPIAWTAFMADKFDLSRKYYEEIIEKKSSAQDYLNAGHVELTEGNKKASIKLYVKSAELFDTFDQFVEAFETDKSIMIGKGVDNNLIAYILDQVGYLSNK